MVMKMPNTNAALIHHPTGKSQSWGNSQLFDQSYAHKQMTYFAIAYSNAKDNLTHFQFLTFLARDLRGLAGIKVYFSFVNVSDSLGLSSEHNFSSLLYTTTLLPRHIAISLHCCNVTL